MRAKTLQKNRIRTLAVVSILLCGAGTVLADYATKVLSLSPVGYWRLNDAGDPTTNAVAQDSSPNGLHGYYGVDLQNGFNGIQGPRTPGFPGFSSDNSAILGTRGPTDSYVHLPKVPVGQSWVPTNTMTFTLWIKPEADQTAWAGLLCSRGGPQPGGVDFNSLGAQPYSLGYIWNNDSSWSFDSGLKPPANQWSFVAVAIEPTKATLYLNYVDAVTGVTNYLSAVNPTPHLVQDLGTNYWRLGCDFNGSRNFNGLIDEAAVFTRTLSASEVTRIFAAGLGMTAVAPAISQQPVTKTVYEGRTVHFTAGASGTPAPTFQWQARPAGGGAYTDLVDGPNISGATTTTLTVRNVTANSAGDYRIVASNAGGNTPSAGATLTVLTVQGLGSYPNAVYTNGPIAYWRLGESYSNTNAVDFAGDLMGVYQVAALWGANAPGGAITGPSGSGFPGFEASNTAVETTGDGVANSWVYVPTPPLKTNSATFIAWIRPSVVPQPNWAGIYMIDANYIEPGICFTTDGQFGYAWNNSATLNFLSGLVPPADQWSMVACVIEPTMATLYMGTGGTLTNVINQTAHIQEIAWGLQGAIGVDRGLPERAFQGVIDEVAMFDKALSFDQISTLYGVAIGNIQTVAPRFVREPASATRYAGMTATFSALLTGNTPSYQWYKGNQPLTNGGKVSGANTDSLALTGVALADAGDYKLVASNSAGSITSSVVTLTVLSPATPFENAVISAQPLAYWRLNETNDPASTTVIAGDYIGGFDGTYGLASQNGFNSVAGPRTADGFSIFENSNTALRSANGVGASWVRAPQPVLNSANVSFTMWIFPEGDQADWSGLFMNRSGAGEGVGFGGDLGGGSTSHGMLGYTWNNNTTWNYVSGLTPPLSQWSFVAVTIEPSRAILYVLNTNGTQSATNAIPQIPGTWGGTASIGADGNTAGRAFSGIIDEVALFNYTLSPQQVQSLYAGQNSSPILPKLSIAKGPGNQLTIDWEGAGTLQSTPLLQGTSTVWTDLGSTKPVVVTPTGAAQFYRVRR